MVHHDTAPRAKKDAVLLALTLIRLDEMDKALLPSDILLFVFHLINKIRLVIWLEGSHLKPRMAQIFLMKKQKCLATNDTNRHECFNFKKNGIPRLLPTAQL